MKPLVMIVDDTPSNINVLASLLKGSYDLRIANNGSNAIELAQKSPVPDAILLDVMMPKMDGWTVCQHLKSIPATSRIPIIFLTAKNTFDDEEYGLNLGAVDFISKPFSPAVVLARVRTHLQNREYQRFLEDRSGWLEMEVQKKLTRINKLQDASILVMVSLAEFRDDCTGGHIRRTQEFVREIARYLAGKPSMEMILTEEYIDQLYKSAPLHDIGKIAIPDHILLKPGKLTPAEMDLMKTHTVKGEQFLRQARQYDADNEIFLQVAIEIALSHHERWDGKGYPHGLSGEDIPLAARIMAVADVYDALTSQRPYKAPFSHNEAYDFLVNNSGGHFDPDVVAAFKSCAGKFLEIAAKFSDASDTTENREDLSGIAHHLQPRIEMPSL